MSIGSAIAATLGGAIIIGATVAGMAAIGVFGAEYNFRLTEHYQPKYEQVRRETFESSQAYNEGVQRDIANLRLDWLGASGGQKDAIRSLALERINGLPSSTRTPQIEAFRSELESSN